MFLHQTYLGMVWVPILTSCVAYARVELQFKCSASPSFQLVWVKNSISIWIPADLKISNTPNLGPYPKKTVSTITKTVQKCGCFAGKNAAQFLVVQFGSSFFAKSEEMVLFPTKKLPLWPEFRFLRRCLTTGSCVCRGKKGSKWRWNLESDGDFMSSAWSNLETKKCILACPLSILMLIPQGSAEEFASAPKAARKPIISSSHFPIFNFFQQSHQPQAFPIQIVTFQSSLTESSPRFLLLLLDAAYFDPDSSGELRLRVPSVIPPLPPDPQQDAGNFDVEPCFGSLFWIFLDVLFNVIAGQYDILISMLFRYGIPVSKDHKISLSK